MRTLSEIRSHVSDIVHETGINDLIDEMINNTLQEINSPSWAFTKGNMKGYHHNWSFLRRKHTFSTVASTEEYQLPRDLDKISIIRQTESPARLEYVPDEVFYEILPNPTTEGNPLYYRLWEEEGVSTRLSTDDTITIVSSSTSDTTPTISIVGYDTNGITQSEELTLNGTTDVNGSTTFDAGRPLRISKSAKTVGNITVKETTSGTTLLTLGKEERTARFKVIGLYPIPDAAMTMYLEYFTRIRWLTNDSDVADIDEKWMHVVRAGTLAKLYQYQNKPADMMVAYNTMYRDLVQSMVKSDIQNPDYIPMLRSHRNRWYGDWFRLRTDNVTT